MEACIGHRYQMMMIIFLMYQLVGLGKISLTWISQKRGLILALFCPHRIHRSRSSKGLEDMAKVWVPGIPDTLSQGAQASKTFMGLLSRAILWKVDYTFHVKPLVYQCPRKRLFFSRRVDGLRHMAWVSTVCMRSSPVDHGTAIREGGGRWDCVLALHIRS